MALTRAFLRGLGLEDDKIGAIIEAHAETVDGLKAANRSESEELQKQLETLKAQIETGKTGAAEWESKYNELTDEFNKYKDDLQSKAARETKENAYRALLKAAGVSDKRIESIMKVTDLDSISLNKDGAIRDSEKVTETIKTEWADFISVEHTAGASVPTPPAAGAAKLSKDQIMAITDTKQRQQAIADNIELFQ